MFWPWILGTLALSPFLMLILLIGLQKIINYFSHSHKIKTQAELEELLKKERGKLGLSDKNIKIILKPHHEHPSSVRKLTSGPYLIECRPGITRTSVAHELYHIYDGAADQFRVLGTITRWIKHLYWWEPRAIFYEFKRLRALNRQPN